MISVVPHCGYLSETSRMLEIHRALRERGAPVRLATHGGTHQNLLGRAGADYDLIEPRLTPARCAPSGSFSRPVSCSGRRWTLGCAPTT